MIKCRLGWDQGRQDRFCLMLDKGPLGISLFLKSDAELCLYTLIIRVFSLSQNVRQPRRLTRLGIC